MSKTLVKLLDDLAPEVRDAFVRSVQNQLGEINVNSLVKALQNNDVSAIHRIMQMNSGHLTNLDRVLAAAHTRGGDTIMAELQRAARRQGVGVSAAFGGFSPEVADWLRVQSARRITAMSLAQQEVVADQLARLVAQGGISPRGAALEMVGRINKVTGLREGGTLGLRPQTTRAGAKIGAGLRSGDREQMQRYLSSMVDVNGRPQRYMKNKRGIAIVKRAIRTGKPIPGEQVDQIMRTWHNQKLMQRGETVARTELLSTLSHAQDAALKEMIERENLAPDAVTRTWRSSKDPYTRDSHRDMDGSSRRVDEPFVTGAGYQMKYPGDASLGAPAAEIVNCRCHLVTRVDFITGLRDRLSPEELAEVQARAPARAKPKPKPKPKPEPDKNDPTYTRRERGVVDMDEVASEAYLAERYDKLLPQRQTAISRYVGGAAWDGSSSEDVYSLLNAALRSGKRVDPRWKLNDGSSFGALEGNLKAAASPLGGDIVPTLWRGIESPQVTAPDLLKKLKPGAKLKASGYTSTSMSRKVAESFSGKTGVTMEILPSSKTKAIPTYFGEGEFELILPPNAELRVLTVTKTEDGGLHVVLKTLD